MLYTLASTFTDDTPDAAQRRAALVAAAERAAEGVTVLEDLYGSVEYKTHLASVYVKRALEEAVARA